MIVVVRRIITAVVLSAFLSPLAISADTPLLIPVRQNSKFGYINSNGKVVIPFQFDYAFSFAEGLAQVGQGRHWTKCGYIDLSGRLVIPYRRCFSYSSFREGFALFRLTREGHDRFLDRKGRFLKTAKFAFAHQFSEGLAAVRPQSFPLDGKCCWGYIGKDGRMVIPPKFEDHPGTFSEGLAYVRIDGKVGFIDHRGEFVVPPQYEEAQDFSEGLAPVRLNGKWGFINRQGTFVIPPQFSGARSFSDGLAVAYATEVKAGYIDKQGHWAVEPKYQQTYPFRDGYGGVVNGYVGYVDTSGREVLPVQYSEASYLGEGLFSVEIRHEHAEEYAIVNTEGTVIYRYTIALTETE